MAAVAIPATARLTRRERVQRRREYKPRHAASESAKEISVSKWLARTWRALLVAVSTTVLVAASAWFVAVQGELLGAVVAAQSAVLGIAILRIVALDRDVAALKQRRAEWRPRR